MNDEWLRLRQGLLTYGVHFGELPPHVILYDCREFLMHKDYGFAAAKLLWKKLKKYNAEVLYGEGYGAAAVLFNLQAAAAADGVFVSTLLVREQRKERNRRRLVEGPRPRANAKAIFVDDIINAGNTCQKLESRLLEDGIKVLTVAYACVFDGVKTHYSPHGTRAIRARGKPVEALFTRHDLGITRVDAKKSLIKNTAWRFLPRQWGNENRPKAGPKLYKDRVFYALDSGDVYCLDAGTSEIYWKFSSQRPWHPELDISSELVIFEDRLYYSCYDGITRCLDIFTGDIIWERLLATYQHSTVEIDPDLRFLYLNGEVLEYNHTTKRASNTSSDISCVNVDTGDLIWRSPPIHATGPGSCKIVDQDTLVVSSNDQHLRCHNRHDGSLLWTVKFLGDIKGKAAVFDNKIYAVCEQGNFQIIERNGQVLKNFRVGVKSRHQFVAVSEQHRCILIVAQHYVHCYNEHGDRLWVTSTRGNLVTSGVVYKDYFLTISETGYVLVVDINTGNKVTSDYTNIKTNSLPYWDNNKLIIQGLRKGLFVFDTHDIEEQARCQNM